MNGAMGAYAISTGTIYLNVDWLAGATKEQVLAVLTEELGHHLDGVLNSVDTVGDEGEYFSCLLLKKIWDFAPPQNDSILIGIDGNLVLAEAAENSNDFYSARIGVGYGFGSVSEVLINGQSIRTESQFNGASQAASELAARINSSFTNIQASIALDSTSTIIVRSTVPGTSFTISAVRSAGITSDNLVDDDLIEIALTSNVPSITNGSSYVVTANDLSGDAENIYAFLERRWYIVGADGARNQILGASNLSTSVSSRDDITLQYEVDYIDGELNTRTGSSSISLKGLNKGQATISITGAANPSAPAVNETLTATNTTADPDGNGSGGFTYSWQTSTNGTSWSNVGTNSASYTVASTDEGQQLRLVTTYTDAQGFSESVTTSAGTIPLVNEAPTDLVFTSSGINENSAAGTVIGTLSATDPDAASSFTYALATGNGTNDADNSLVEIVGNEVKVKSGASIDFETNPTLNLNIQVTDNGTPGLTYTKAVTASVINVNEAPTDLVFTSSGINENSAAGTVIGTLSATDPDAASSFTYALATPRFQESCHPSHSYIRGLEDMTNASLQRGRQG
jgi:hypothetical protein